MEKTREDRLDAGPKGNKTQTPTAGCLAVEGTPSDPQRVTSPPLVPLSRLTAPRWRPRRRPRHPCQTTAKGGGGVRRPRPSKVGHKWDSASRGESGVCPAAKEKEQGRGGGGSGNCHHPHPLAWPGSRRQARHSAGCEAGSQLWRPRPLTGCTYRTSRGAGSSLPQHSRADSAKGDRRGARG